jgi:tetratricopeptide (TPR) repeat protein
MQKTVFILIALFIISSYAEKILIYDEEKGIIYEEVVTKTIIKKVPKEDIHVDRKKDPPELYFNSGLEYFKNGDYKNALKNFKYAADKDLKPEYLLWIGKTSRKMDKPSQMFSIMERILKDYPDSDVADDALFEMAFYYQKNYDYHQAMEKYAQLAEQYPFGLSYSNGKEFLKVSRTQRKWMQDKVMSDLKFLGIEGKTLEDVYKQFQKAYGIKPTGKGDQETVQAIKTTYAKKVEEEERRAASMRQLKESLVWAYIVGGVLILNLFLVLSMFFKINQNRKQLFFLRGILSDLE